MGWRRDALSERRRSAFRCRHAFLFLLAVLTCAVTLCGCGGSSVAVEQEEEEVTYESLSAEEQAVVDFIYGMKRVWDYDYCTRIVFTTHDGVNAIEASYLKSSGYEESIYYSYDLESCEFEKVDSSFTVYEVIGNTSTSDFLSSYRVNWHHNWSETEQKDKLAQLYMSFLER